MFSSLIKKILKIKNVVQVHEIIFAKQEEEESLNQNSTETKEFKKVNLISFDEWSCSNVDAEPYNFFLCAAFAFPRRV